MRINPVANLDSVKQHNLARLFTIIVEYGLISRTQLVETSNMAAGTVTKLSRLLIDQGLVHEVAHKASERGRKAVLLAPKSDDIQILAARVDHEFIYIGLCDLSGNLLHRTVKPLIAHDEPTFIKQICQSLRAFLASQQNMTTQIIGLGITMPGIVNPETQSVISIPGINISHLALANILEKELQLPCYLNNFSSAMALAEKQLGASFHAKHSVFIDVGAEIKAGLIINNVLVDNMGLGEIGHLQLDPAGELCSCGRVGCLNTIVAVPAIVRQYSARKALDPESVSFNSLLMQALDYDEDAMSVLKSAAEQLGAAIASLVNLIRPEMIVVGGKITEAWSMIEPILQGQIQAKSLQIAGVKAVQLTPSELYESPWYSGYALVREALLTGQLLPTLLNAKQPVDMSRF